MENECSLGVLHQRRKEIGLENADSVLQNGSHAFETHAGINRGLRERIQLAVGVAIELHEDEVPDFDVAAAIAGEFAIGVTFV